MNSTALLLLKLTLAPGLVGLATLLMARLGPQFGGLVAALPVVGGPILLLFAIEQGNGFAAEAASKTLVGTLALLGYTSMYVALARQRHVRRWPWFCMLAGWLSFLGISIALEQLRWPKFTGIAIALTAIAAALKMSSRQSTQAVPVAARPTTVHLLVVRMAAAAVMVTLLTWGASTLGSTWSGLLTAFPVVSTVMLVATHIEQGLDTALRWLHGFYWGLLGYIAFVSTIAYGLEALGITLTFGIGIVGAVIVQATIRWRIRT